MPTYVYRCIECGEEMEVMHRANDWGPDKCLKCYGKLKRKIFPTPSIFNGTGFHVTDYPRAGGK